MPAPPPFSTASVPHLHEHVLQAAALVADPGRRRDAERAVRALKERVDVAGTPAERVAARFAQALALRLRGAGAEEGGNLYAAPAHGPRDMLAAFETLVARTPLVRFGHHLARETLLEACEGAREVHLIDIGIGTGVQWEPFIDALAARASPPRLHLTGIDVPLDGDPEGARIRAVGDRLSAKAAEANLPFAFRAVAAYVEDLDEDALHGEAPAVDATVLVNAAFALHHTPAGDGVTDPARSRDAVLERIAALRPRAFTLIEPDVEHNALPFLPRVEASLAHYSLVFDALGTLLRDDPRDREVLEASFFGREIQNVVAHEGPARVERHESRAAWEARLTRAGFSPTALGGVSMVAGSLGPRFEVAEAGGGATLQWGGYPVVAASAWRTP